MITAESLLKAWRAPALVSNVELDAGAHKVSRADNTAVSALRFGKTISWTGVDRTMPMPVDLTEPEIALAIYSSDLWTPIADWRDSSNHLPGGAVDGMIALQVHGGDRWIPGLQHCFRNVVLRELP